MAETVAAHEVARVLKYQELLECRSKRSFVLMAPVAGLHDPLLFATFLIFVGLDQEDVLVWDSGSTPGMVHAVNQDESFSMAQKWARDLGCDGTDRCLLLEMEMGNSKARATIFYSRSLPTIFGAVPTSISDIMGCPLGELAVRSLAQVQRMVGVTAIGKQPISGWASGRMAGTAAHQSEIVSGPSDEDKVRWELELARQHKFVTQARRLLKDDGSPDMAEWADRLTATDTSDVPENLKAPDSLDFSGVEIPDPHCPVYTTWQPLPNKQQLPKKPAPQDWLSAVRPIYRSEALRRVRAFQKKMTNWLAGKSERPKTVVIPGLWLEHWVFETPHDFHSEPGWAVPIDVSTPSSTHLNLPFYEGFGEGYISRSRINQLPRSWSEIQSRSACADRATTSLEFFLASARKVS